MGASSKQNVCSTSNNIKFIMKKLFLLFSILFIFSCQPVEQLESIVFDNQQLSKFDVSSKTIEIKAIFEKKFSDPYIGHTIEVDPSQRIISWVNDNFKSIGNENIFIVAMNVKLCISFCVRYVLIFFSNVGKCNPDLIYSA